MTFLVYMTGLLLFAHFGLLQVWRFIPRLENSNPGLVLLVMIVAIAAWSRALIRSISSDGNLSQKVRLLPKDRMYLGGSILFGFLLWLIWIEPSLFRSLNVWGDEDHHFNVSYQFAKYFKTYFQFALPSTAAPHVLRYGNLAQLWYFWFLNPFTGPIDSPFWQRFPLLFPYLATVAASFLIAFHSLKDRTQSLLYTLAYASCPVLLCYTADKYLDIFHPAFFAISSYAIYRMIVSQSSIFALIAALTTGLLSLVRENSAPTTLLYGGLLFLFFSPILGFGPRKVKSWKNAILYSSTAVLPFVCFYKLKMNQTNIDIDRLFLKNIFYQNYSDFFKFLFLYFPQLILLILFAFVARGLLNRRKVKLIGIGVICLSIASQFLIYSLFQPGWMPWTRNYMMFIGQLSVLVLIAFSEIIQSQSKQIKTAAISILVLSLSFNLVFGSLELSSNQYFHENELHFDYQTLFSTLKAKPILPPRTIVYMNTSGYMPASIEYSAKQIGSHFQYKDVVNKATFLPLDSFISFLPAGPRYILFHYRRHQSVMPVLMNNPIVDRPTEQQLTNFEVLVDVPDPWSKGKIGLLLLKKLR